MTMTTPTTWRGLPQWLVPPRERRVLEALRRVDRPVSNQELAVLMDCSEAESSKRVAKVRPMLALEKVGKELRISLASRREAA